MLNAGVLIGQKLDFAKLILGINSPWFIKDVSFDNKQLNIHIDFKKGTKFTDSSADTKAYQRCQYCSNLD
jgi:hypothetical protein